ncbi:MULTISPECIES: HdeD family acid-resistance protein [unclassified Ruminococcus]|uniref:HdeD family acid-resistance protein n=1 Tax=unclassified Ruminococcus TaxID=2608920 RepID=UPI00210CA301|nr:MULTISPECIES: DUF308 domain-containing protein [unclassified Ruminococcus]MCQ4023372.1 hypothetical protein [Ruminococcus sp. zg-924]MCQ4115739.1 hypothetical protein [Ruminococcus sp. zg-921]
MKVFIKVLWAIGGVLLLLAGLATFFNPLASIITVSYIIGGALLIAGLLNIIAYFASRKVMLGAGWVLADGILSIIFGAMICFGEYSKGFLTLTIGVLVGIWLLVSGINYLSRSFDMHRLHAKGWGWLTVWGILCIIAGVIVFCNPIITAINIADIVVGLSLIVGGIAMLFRCFTRDIES